MTKFLQENRNPDAPAFQKVTDVDAAKLIGVSSFDDYVGFDKVEAERLGIKLGQIVSIAPDDTGKILGLLEISPSIEPWSIVGKNHDASGKLLGLNKEEFVIAVQGSSGSPARCHLPRLNYVIKGTKAKL
jgi:hypothetical protein